jgi:hypothetical protein
MTLEGATTRRRRHGLVGDGPGMEGKPTRWKSVTQAKDDDTLLSMDVGDAKDPLFTVSYKRKK